MEASQPSRGRKLAVITTTSIARVRGGCNRVTGTPARVADCSGACVGNRSKLLAVQGIYGTVQVMTRTNSFSNPVVASYGGVEVHCRVRELRGDRSLADAARLVGLNRDELARIERGQTVQIRFETIAKLMSGYGCAIGDLLEVVSLGDDQAVAPWSAPLAALREGRVRSGVPGRRDPDEIVEELLPIEVANLFVEDNSEDVQANGVRRSAFRPAAHQ